MKTLKISLFVMLLGVIIASCSKTGPAGPTGPAGANGVANITTNTYTVTPGQWNTYSAGAVYDATIAVSALTNSNTDNVEVSASESNTNGNWFLLPANNTFASSDEMAVLYNTGQVQLFYFYTSPPTVTIYIKVSVIPPAMIHQHPGLTKNQIIQLNQ